MEDFYKAYIIKEGTRQKRGVKGPRVYITSSSQKMSQGQKWHSVLTVNENKTDLSSYFAEYLELKSTEYFRLPVKITVIEIEKTIQFNQASWTHLDKCNHEVADISIALHAANSDATSMIISNDTCIKVVFLFLVYACYKGNPKQLWCMK